MEIEALLGILLLYIFPIIYMAKTKYINNSNKREYTVILTDTEAISIKDFAEDITGNYNPHEDFKIIAKQVKAQVDSNFKEYQA